MLTLVRTCKINQFRVRTPPSFYVLWSNLKESYCIYFRLDTMYSNRYFTNYATCPWLSLLCPWLSLLYPWLSLLYPWLSLPYPCLSMLYPWLSQVSMISLVCPWCVPVCTVCTSADASFVRCNRLC